MTREIEWDMEVHHWNIMASSTTDCWVSVGNLRINKTEFFPMMHILHLPPNRCLGAAGWLSVLTLFPSDVFTFGIHEVCFPASGVWRVTPLKILILNNSLPYTMLHQFNKLFNTLLNQSFIAIEYYSIIHHDASQYQFRCSDLNRLLQRRRSCWSRGWFVCVGGRAGEIMIRRRPITVLQFFILNPQVLLLLTSPP